MASYKACSIHLRGFLLKSKIGGQCIIAHQPHSIPRRVGYVGIGKQQEQAIYSVMNGRTYGAHNAETYHAPEVCTHLRMLLPQLFISADAHLR